MRTGEEGGWVCGGEVMGMSGHDEKEWSEGGTFLRG